MKRIKESGYNLIFPLNDNKYILYNTLRNSLILLDRECLDIIKAGHFEKLPSKIFNHALELGVLIDEDLDEIALIKVLKKQLYTKRYYLHIGLTLLMTYSCNLRCPYCYEGTRKNFGGMLTPEKIDSIIKFSLNHKMNEEHKLWINVSFYGGEPLLNWTGCKRAIEKLDRLAENGDIFGYNASFTTNGTLITEEVIKYINEYNITSMQITLDGPKDIHDTRRITPQGEGTFDKIIENAKLIKENVQKRSFYLNFRINIDKTNYHRIPELLEYLKNNGLNKTHISFGIIRGDVPYSCNSHNLLLVGNDLPRILPYLWKEAFKLGFYIQTRTNTRLEYCMYEKLFSYLIDPNLDVYPCWEMAGIKKYRIGKINENGTFKPLPFYYNAKARDTTEFKECKNCKFLPICMGGCVMESIRRNGSPNGPGCDISRYIWKEGIKFYIAKRYPQLFDEKQLVNILGTVPHDSIMKLELGTAKGGDRK